MIHEPFICVRGSRSGEIDYVTYNTPPSGKVIPDADGNDWQPYADFEREKLRAFSQKWSSSKDGSNPLFVVWNILVDDHLAYRLLNHDSKTLIGYSSSLYDLDSESGRLLKRAEFLKAVCEKEGVEWLPAEKWDCCDRPKDSPREVTIEPERPCQNPLRCGSFCKGECRKDEDAKRELERQICRGNCHDMNCHGCNSRELAERPKRDTYTKDEIQFLCVGRAEFADAMQRLEKQIKALSDKRR